jgi:hypothetical protein
MVFNVTFNNMSVLLVEETEVPEKTTDMWRLKISYIGNLFKVRFICNIPIYSGFCLDTFHFMTQLLSE